MVKKISYLWVGLFVILSLGFAVAQVSHPAGQVIVSGGGTLEAALSGFIPGAQICTSASSGDTDCVDNTASVIGDLSCGAANCDANADGIIDNAGDVSCADCLTASDLAANSVGASEIAAGAVGTSEVSDNSLTASDLAANSVGASEIAANAVAASEIAAGAVGYSELATNAVGSVKISANAVGASEIAAGAVGTSEVSDNSLTASDLAASSVGTSEIAAGAVGTSELGSVAYIEMVRSASGGYGPYIDLTRDGPDYDLRLMTKLDRYVWDTPVYDLRLEHRSGTYGDLRVFGAAFANSHPTFSDVRLKEDIRPIPNALDRVLQLQGVNFKRIDGQRPVEMGFIAQSVEPIFPEVVTTDGKGYKSVDYPSLLAVLTEAMKEQQEQIEELKQTVCQDHPEKEFC